MLVCLSGGLDSAVVLVMLREQHECAAVSFDYGQRHIIELDYARRIAPDVRTVVLPRIPLADDVVFAGRNLVLAAHAITIAAAERYDAVALGCNRTDGDRFPDCRPAFWDAVNAAASAAYGVAVLLPLLRMSKAEVVSEAIRRGIRLTETWSCYDPQGTEPCGRCLACKMLAEALA
jgi:7-cyano-7-deazaguanine synthase